MSINNTVNVPRRSQSGGAAWLLGALVVAAAVIALLFYGLPERALSPGVQNTVTIEQAAQPEAATPPAAEAPAADSAPAEAPAAGEAPANSSSAPTTAQ